MSKDLTVVQTGWLEKWEKAEIPWHKPEVDNNIQRHLEELTQGQPSAFILVTWCGKSVDMPWLCSQGYNVVGIELSAVAVRQFFEENKIPYSTSVTTHQATGEEFVVYRAQDRKLTIRVFLGDYYNLKTMPLATLEDLKKARVEPTKADGASTLDGSTGETSAKTSLEESKGLEVTQTRDGEV